MNDVMSFSPLSYVLSQMLKEFNSCTTREFVIIILNCLNNKHKRYKRRQEIDKGNRLFENCLRTDKTLHDMPIN